MHQLRRSLLLLALVAASQPALANDTTTRLQTAAPAAPAPDPEMTTLLSEPLTPGIVALLAEFAPHAQTQQRLGEAFSSPDPAVRIVAARVAMATRSAGQIPALRRALTSERDPLAAAEVVRALLVLRGAAAEPWVVPALPHLGRPALVTFVEILARTRPESLAKTLATLEIPGASEREIGEALSLSIRQNPGHIDALVTALRALDRPRVWSACLKDVQDRTREFPELLLENALASSAPGVRTDARVDGRASPPR